MTKKQTPPKRPTPRRASDKTRVAPGESEKVAAVKTRLDVASLPLASVTPDPANTQKHGESDVRKTAASYVRFGEQEPIVVRETTDEDRAAGVTTPYVTVAGAGRHEALRRLDAGLYDGHGFCAGNPQKGRWPAVSALVTTLRDLEAMAFGIAHNQTGRNAEQNWERIAEQIARLKKYDEQIRGSFDAEHVGFEPAVIKPLLVGDFSNVQGLSASPSRLTSRPADPSDDANNAAPIYTTPNSRLTLDAAIAKVRDMTGDDAMSETRALELIAGDFLSGAPLDNDDAKSAPGDGQPAASVKTKESPGAQSQMGDLEYRVIILCAGEDHQAELLARFESEGLEARALIS
jgi:ParB-like nuclease domain